MQQQHLPIKILLHLLHKIVAEYEQGAYTGEVSAKMLASLNVQFVIIGHSERRQYFNENDEILLQKLLQVHKQHLTPNFLLR